MTAGRRVTSNARIDRSYSYARPSQIGAVRGVVSLSLLVLNAENRVYVESLPPRVARLLSWYAALHRTGAGAWRGTECHYEAMSQAIRAATLEPASVGTLKRALAEAAREGLVSLTWCTPERLPHGKGQRPGAGKVEIGAGVWRTLRIRRVTLTAKAIALWSRTPGAPAPVSGPLSDTPLPRSKSSSILRADSSLQETKTDRGSACVRPAGLEAGSGAVRSTRPAPPAAAPTLEHQALNEAAATSAAASGRTDGRSGFAVGVKRPPPKRPAPSAANTWSNGRLALLADLHVFLRAFPQRQASCLFERARAETASIWPRGWPACLSWDHFVPRWRAMLRAERFGVLRRVVLPALLSAARAPSCDGLGKLPPAAAPTPLEAPPASRPAEIAAEIAAVSSAADIAAAFRAIAAGASDDKRRRLEKGAQSVLDRARAAEERDRKRWGV